MQTDCKGLTLPLGLVLLLGIASPVVAEDTAASSPSGTATTNASASQIAPININTADATLLTELPGIGDVKATTIIEDRDANGPFESADDLTRVRGIGAATVEALEDEITY